MLGSLFIEVAGPREVFNLLREDYLRMTASTNMFCSNAFMANFVYTRTTSRAFI